MQHERDDPGIGERASVLLYQLVNNVTICHDSDPNLNLILQIRAMNIAPFRRSKSPLFSPPLLRYYFLMIHLIVLWDVSIFLQIEVTVELPDGQVANFSVPHDGALQHIEKFVQVLTRISQFLFFKPTLTPSPLHWNRREPGLRLRTWSLPAMDFSFVLNIFHSPKYPSLPRSPASGVGRIF